MRLDLLICHGKGYPAWGPELGSAAAPPRTVRSMLCGRPKVVCVWAQERARGAASVIGRETDRPGGTAGPAKRMFILIL
eukprot:SAG31_NODE_2426_length_5721_cov_11.664176_2_plen_79_part_00